MCRVQIGNNLLWVDTEVYYHVLNQEKAIATKDNELKQLKEEMLQLKVTNNQLKDECYKKRNDNKSLRGTIKSILETSNNRHKEIKRLLKKIEKLELNHKQLKDLDKTQKQISKLLKQKEELKKWLEWHKVVPHSLSTIYARLEYSFYRGVLSKIEELENDK